jgi:antitoxin component YwqK of YwqJK toxin-antitoxin module
MVLLFPALALGETMDDLVEQDGLFYKEFTDVPFTGNITGKTQGTIRNGKKVGPWVYYHINGQLWSKGTYKDGKKDGPWVYYHINGQLWSKGTYKDGKKEGPFVDYHDNGQLLSKGTGTYKDGKIIVKD